MGGKLKVLAVVVGLMIIPVGGWPFSLVLFAYAASGLFIRGVRRGGKAARRNDAAPSSEVGSSNTQPVSLRSGRGSPVRLIVGLGMLALSVAAFTQGGTYSPFVLGGLGVAVLVWRAPFNRLGSLGVLHPVDESVLFRMGFDPIHWYAVAEVKLATRQVGKALGGIDGSLVVTTAEKPTILVVLRTASLTLGGAEEALISRLRQVSRVSAPLGAYILPIDSEKAVGLLRFSVEPVELDSKGWPSSLSTTDYDVLSMEARRGVLRSVGAYRTTEDVGNGSGPVGKASLPPSRQVTSRPPLLWEVFQELGKKIQWSKPDEYTTFLASIFATRGEAIGERVVEAGNASNSREVLVQSLGTPTVQLSRAQLRAIARIYA